MPILSMKEKKGWQARYAGPIESLNLSWSKKNIDVKCLTLNKHFSLLQDLSSPAGAENDHWRQFLKVYLTQNVKNR
jgi:hypothetical protein